MFQLVGLGEQAGSGFPKIYRNWSEQHWKNPELEQRFETNQTVLVLRMTSLLPEDVVSYLKESLGKTFDSLDPLQRIALVTAKAEGCVTHRRLIELSKEHPIQITRILHGLVDEGILKSEGAGKGTFYYLDGEHPIKGDIFRDTDLFVESLEHLSSNSEHFGPEPRTFGPEPRTFGPELRTFGPELRTFGSELRTFRANKANSKKDYRVKKKFQRFG